VSIKPSHEPRNGPVRFGPGRAFSDSVSAFRIILAAYKLKEYQLIGVTGWIDSDWFALEAKTEASVDENQLRLRLQTLLSKRFGLVVHRERRNTSVYSLVTAKGGTKLRQWNEGDPLPARVSTTSADSASHETMESLVGLMNLSGFQRISGIDRPVLDKTGLKGSYLVFNSWYDSWEEFPNVLSDKMGLKLLPQKVPMDVLVIDHIEKPWAN
jgi:uncharacterized protein (TIGR03435 family)